jgi:hypothetical protein
MLSAIMLSAIMLSAIMLSVVMLSDVMLSVVGPTDSILRISDDLFPAKFSQFTKYFFVSCAAKGGSLLLLYRKRSCICIVPCVSK